MSEIAAVDYRDSPVVSTELVKFLSLNTSVEKVDKLDILTGELSTMVKEMTKEFTKNKKSLSSVGNRTDELKKVVEGLRLRIVKLEK